MSAAQGWEPAVLTPGALGLEANIEGVTAIQPDPVEHNLLRHKALLFRGFAVTAEDLDRVLDLLIPDRLAYVHGNSPRTKVGRNLYTSTEYPSELVISMHSEMSYAARWPARLAFFCEQRAETGGATPVVDTAAWLEAIDPAVRSAFAGGVRYTQNLHGGFGLGRSWQDTFETTDPAEVESFLNDAKAEWSWKSDGGIRISQIRPATINHPVTGAEVWFNQVDQWHTAALDNETAAELAGLFPEEEELPQSVTFADGAPIPAEYALHVRDQGLRMAVDVEWQNGDILLIDNVLVAHGRRSFSGTRKVLVAMSG